ncbi:MAG: AraC family transcriptional regulator, partial [Gammaproteobacteria bacterium]
MLVADFSLIAFSSAFDALRMANRMREQKIYEWQVLTYDGRPISSSSGLMITPDGDVSSAADLDILFVCAGDNVHLAADKPLLFWLRKLAQKKIVLGAMCTGSYLLARAGLLDGYRCTIHWENMASMREEFPNAIISQELFEIDRERYTCSGGTAPLDMMLNIISRHHGAQLAVAISEEFICERIRGRHDRQRVPLRLHLGT